MKKTGRDTSDNTPVEVELVPVRNFHEHAHRLDEHTGEQRKVKRFLVRVTIVIVLLSIVTSTAAALWLMKGCH